MRKRLKWWTFRLLFTGLFLLGLLVTFMLNPVLLYANKTVQGNYSIYHSKPLDKKLLPHLEQSIAIVQGSELYDPKIKIDICLKDGSTYPGLVQKVMGRDVLSSFYNKIVFTGDEVNFDKNYIQLYAHKWNLTQMLAHAQIHCLEFKKYGLWKSNPIGGHPEWKWEGYPEYIARQNAQIGNLQTGIKTLLLTQQIANNGWMKLRDSTEIIIHYFKYRLLVQYCLEVKKFSFGQLLQDTTQEETVRQEMMNWYSKQPD
jgi:hypothetical protein